PAPTYIYTLSLHDALPISEPESQRYTTSLTITYADPARPEDVYVFLPALRRYQPISAAARCAAFAGMDFTDEDFRSGFDSNLARSEEHTSELQSPCNLVCR